MLIPRSIPTQHALRAPASAPFPFSIFTFPISVSLLLRISDRVLVLVLLLYFRTVQFSFALRYRFICNMNRAIQHGGFSLRPRRHSLAPRLEVPQQSNLSRSVCPPANWRASLPLSSRLKSAKVTATLKETESLVSHRKQTIGPLSDRNTLPYFYFRPAFAFRPLNVNQRVPFVSLQPLTSNLQPLVPNRNYYGLEIELSYCKQRDLIFSNRNKIGHPCTSSSRTQPRPSRMSVRDLLLAFGRPPTLAPTLLPSAVGTFFVSRTILRDAAEVSPARKCWVLASPRPTTFALYLSQHVLRLPPFPVADRVPRLPFAQTHPRNSSPFAVPSSPRPTTLALALSQHVPRPATNHEFPVQTTNRDPGARFLRATGTLITSHRISNRNSPAIRNRRKLQKTKDRPNSNRNKKRGGASDVLGRYPASGMGSFARFCVPALAYLPAVTDWEQARFARGVGFLNAR